VRNVLGRLRSFIDTGTALSESESERDGLLSYAVEWHVLIVDLAVGMVAGLTGCWELAGVAVAIVLGVRSAPGRLAQLRREPWYALGGLVIGLFLTIGVMSLV
jgi:hypothetical protein